MTEINTGVFALTQEQAHTLAVRYNAFCKAVEDNDSNGIVLWGEMLMRSQDETGIVMLRTIERCVHAHRAILLHERVS